MKICPKCRREQTDPRHVGCELCKVPFVDSTELVSHFTKDELKIIASFILKDWRVYVVAGIVLVGGIFLLNWKVGKKITAHVEALQIDASNKIEAQFQLSLKQANNRIADAYATATNQLESKFETFARAASNRIAEAYSNITNEIAAEFQTARIKKTIEDVARGEAKNLLETNVEPVVKRFRDDAEFLRLATRARAYDYKGYLQLNELAKGTNDLSEYAAQVVHEIDRTLERDRSQLQLQSRKYGTFNDGKLFLGPFTSDEIAERFLTVQKDRSTFNREGFVNTVREFQQPLFLYPLIEFLSRETDLTIADGLTVGISELSNESFHPRELQRITNWWESNKARFTNWPIAELQQAWSEFSATRYAAAADSFHRVLVVDAAADKTRALEIACRLEIGETNTATALSKTFKDPSGRWVRWAEAKSLIASGSISNGTARLANLRQEFPGLSAHIGRHDHIWRNADWKLFEELCPLTKP